MKTTANMENPEDHILIEDGEMFDGTRDMFRDCFFDNANNYEIESWCIAESVALTINGIVIIE